MRTQYAIRIAFAKRGREHPIWVRPCRRCLSEGSFLHLRRSPSIFAIERAARPRVNRGGGPPLWYSTIVVWSSSAGAPPRQRPPRPPDMQRGDMPVAYGFLARGLLGDLLERQGDFNQALEHLLHLGDPDAAMWPPLDDQKLRIRHVIQQRGDVNGRHIRKSGLEVQYERGLSYPLAPA